jgi:hypothetical protein
MGQAGRPVLRELLATLIVSAHFECGEAPCGALEHRIGFDQAAVPTIEPFRVPVESPR